MLDDALVHRGLLELELRVSLNPCCAGRCSSTVVSASLKHIKNASLNPCCAGRCSSTVHLLDWMSKEVEVSILVVLDDALVPVKAGKKQLPNERLNPCCAGRCSSTCERKKLDKSEYVSILVVLDDALVRFVLGETIQLTGLNPCCAGRCSSTLMASC